MSNKNRTWEFQITLYFLSHEDYLIFTNAITEEFKEIAKVDWHFTPSNQDEHAIKYFGHWTLHFHLK